MEVLLLWTPTVQSSVSTLNKQQSFYKDGTLIGTPLKTLNATDTYIQIFNYIDKTEYGNEYHAASLQNTTVKCIATLAETQDLGETGIRLHFKRQCK